MTPTKDFVLEALLRHNYFPTQRRRREDIPPVLSSHTFTPQVARQIDQLPESQFRERQGYDAVEYRGTQFTGTPRYFSFPHPGAYARLALTVHTNWDKIAFVAANANSHIKPRSHRDGRLIIMDYDSSFRRSQGLLQGAFGCRFIAKTDIANFFPSIYSHAVPWAAVGTSYAKQHRGRALWFNQLDSRLRSTKRGETQGVAVGPATSNIFAEMILSRVDDSLSKHFRYMRYIDDYMVFCEREEQARDFIRRLSHELAAYNLHLNGGKTEVRSLPEVVESDWISELALRLPPDNEVSAYDALKFLDLAVLVSKRHPEGSVLKYALTTLVRKTLSKGAVYQVLPYVLTLAFHQPALLPLLENWLDESVAGRAFRYDGELQAIAKESAQLRRSDATAWCLYYLRRYAVSVEASTANEVIASEDCVSLLMLYQAGTPAWKSAVVNFANGLAPTDRHGLDRYWLLLYQLFRDGLVGNPCSRDATFDTLNAAGVTFMNP